VIRDKWARLAVLVFFAGCWLVAAGSAARGAHRLWHSNEAELAQAIAAMEQAARPTSLVIARKPHFGHYSGLPQAWPGPDVNGVTALRTYLESRPRGDVLIYIGSEEAKVRPGLRPLVGAEELPAWLERVAGGTDSVPWALLRYARADSEPP
jgi:hypothetical protein